MSPDPAILRLAHELARSLVAQGAEAVVLTGSHARGDATPESDVDLIAVGDGPPAVLVRRDGYLWSIAWQTAAACREGFRDPAVAGTVVPGWRHAVILVDRTGIAAALQAEARVWRWESIATRADAWVAEQVTGFAEEVHKLVNSLAADERWTAAVQRSLLALRMAPILAVHHRLLYETENRLWDLIAERMGPEWRALQVAAFAENGESLEESCAAALALYARTAGETRHLLTAEQEAVVAYACRLAADRSPH